MSSCEPQQFSKASPNLGLLPKSNVFYDIRKVDLYTPTLKKRSNYIVANSFVSDNELQANSNESPKISEFLKEAVNNESIKRTPSPILLKYCKELLDNFSVFITPVHMEHEPFLSREDTELLLQIVKSNEHYKYLGDNDSKLLKHILELNLSAQDKHEKNSLSKTCSDVPVIENSSEVKLLEGLVLEEVSESDEIEFSWSVLEEIFSHRSEFGQYNSAESVSLASRANSKTLQPMNENNLENSLFATPTHNSDYNSLAGSYRNDYLEEEIMETVTKIGNSSNHILVTSREDEENTERCKYIERTEVESENIVEEILRAVTAETIGMGPPQQIDNRMNEIESEIINKAELTLNISGTDENVYTPDIIISDTSLPSNVSTPIPPPPAMPFVTSQPFTKRSPILPQITSEISLMTVGQSSHTERCDSVQYLFTDRAFKESEDKILNAISTKLACTPNLPMALSLRTIRFLDIHRVEKKFYAKRIEIPTATVSSYQKLKITSLSEEFEIKLLTFHELLKIGSFYKIAPSGDSVQLTSVADIIINPEILLDMLKPLEKPPISEKLIDKIRSYDLAKYENVFGEAMQLNLHSARSDSDFEDVNSTRSLESKKYFDIGTGNELRKPTNRGAQASEINSIGVVFDNKKYDPQASDRTTEWSLNDAVVVDTNDESEEPIRESELILEDLYNIDVEVLEDLSNPIEQTHICKATEEWMEPQVNELEGLLVEKSTSMCSFRTAASISSLDSEYLSKR